MREKEESRMVLGFWPQHHLGGLNCMGKTSGLGRVGAQFWVWPYGSPDGVVLWVSGCAICSQGGAAAPELAVMCQERSELFFNLPVTPA